MTVNGTPISPISLNPSGSLILGTNTLSLDTPSALMTTAEDVVFKAQGSGVLAIGGITLSAGGPGTIVSGTAIGTSTIPLPANNVPTFNAAAPFEGVAPGMAEISGLACWSALVAAIALRLGLGLSYEPFSDFGEPNW